MNEYTNENMSDVRRLKLAIIHWTWMAKHPLAEKHDFIPANNWVSECAVCVTGSSCNGCVMLWNWYAEEGGYNDHCNEPSTVFYKWDYPVNHGVLAYDKAFFAWLMVANFEERLAEIMAVN